MIEASLVLFYPFLDLRELPFRSPGPELLLLLELQLTVRCWVSWGPLLGSASWTSPGLG